MSRLLLAGILRNVSPLVVLGVATALTALAAILFLFSEVRIMIYAIYIFLGVGVSAGFPVILGYLGNEYEQLSGSVFSVVFVMALGGNMLINFIMGLLSEEFGIAIFPKYLLVLIVGLLFFLLLVTRNIRSQKES